MLNGLIYAVGGFDGASGLILVVFSLKLFRQKFNTASHAYNNFDICDHHH